MSINSKNIRLLNLHIFFFNLVDRNFWVLFIAFLLKQNLPFWYLFLFALLWNLGYMLLMIPGLNFFRRYGFRLSSMVGIIFYIFLLLSYVFAPFHVLGNVFLFAFLAVGFISFYWPGRHVFASTEIVPHETGKHVAILNISEVLSDSCAVFLFAFLYLHFGTETSHWFLLLFLLCSLLPIFFLSFSSRRKNFPPLNWRSFLSYQSAKERRPFRLAYMSEGLALFFSDLVVILIVVIKVGGIGSYGLITFASSFLLMLLAYVVGRNYDQGRQRSIALNSVSILYFTTLLQAGIPFFLSKIYIIAVGSVARLARKSFSGLLNSVWYHESHYNIAEQNILLREFFLSFGRAAASFVGMLTLYFFELKLDFLLILLTLLPLHYLLRFGFLGERIGKVEIFPADPEHITTP